MTPFHKRALEYVRNTGGAATVKDFIEDHDPIGERLWLELCILNEVDINNDGKIILSLKGKESIKS